jgi:hypothetical protein
VGYLADKAIKYVGLLAVGGKVNRRGGDILLDCRLAVWQFGIVATIIGVLLICFIRDRMGYCRW